MFITVAQIKFLGILQPYFGLIIVNGIMNFTFDGHSNSIMRMVESKFATK